MLGLQRSVGNRALGRSLAASPAHIPVLQHTPVVQRQKSSPPKIRFDRKAIETVRTNAESRHDSITSFIQWSRGNLQSYRSRLLSAAAIYKEAFKRHKRVLDSAGEAARDRAELISTLAGFAVGVALGAPGVVARLGLKATLATSVGSELIELAVGKGASLAFGGPGAGAFEPTAEIPELKELAVWQTLAETNDKLLQVALLTAKQMKIVSAAGIAVAEIRLREGRAKNTEKTDAELQVLVDALVKADAASAEVDADLEAAKAEIQALGANAPKSRTIEEVEQDLWIEWIADLQDDDLLDEDDITDHLESLGVIGEGRVYYDPDTGDTYRQPPRLDVDFGSWVSDDDEEEAVRLARAALGRHASHSSSGGGYYYDED